MPQRLHALIACASLVALPEMASAQTARSAVPVLRTASAAAGSVHGTVRDDLGQAVGDVNVVALGATLAQARSDKAGRFRLALPPGEYILRASHAGYVSTFREPVRVQTSSTLERDITLVRLAVAGEHLLASVPVGAVMQPADPALLPAGAPGPHAHSELAWRLRHLRRTILRDAGPASAGFDEDGRRTDRFEPHRSFLDRALSGSARAATSFFADTDFTGHVNFLTSGSLAPEPGWRPERWSAGIALVSVGAPVGPFGDWTVRGAVRAGDLSSWVFQGEYRSRPDMAHAVHAGMSYSVQGDLSSSIARRLLAADTRKVGAVFGYDRWTVSPRLQLDYGLRLERYDFVTSPARVSPRVGVRLGVVPGVHLTAAAAQHVVAPGAAEFLPPTSSGLWLPPERTFSPLSRSEGYRAERVRHVEVGLEHDFGTDDRPATLAVRWFRQEAASQIATLFGTHAWRTSGHYRVASPGDVDIDGWSVRLAGAVDRRVQVAVDYTVGAARWATTGDLDRLRRLAPGAARTGSEHLHDVTMSVHADVPESDTSVVLAYRVSSGFAHLAERGPTSGLGARFDVEIHQGLPYRPLRDSQLELLLALRNLFRDARAEGSLYDELLTVAPPLRLMGGVRIRF